MKCIFLSILYANILDLKKAAATTKQLHACVKFQAE